MKFKSSYVTQIRICKDWIKDNEKKILELTEKNLQLEKLKEELEKKEISK